MGSYFTQEHEMMRSSLREFVEREVRPNVLHWEEEGELPRSLFEKLGQLGYLGLRLSDEYGGAGLDFWHTAVLVQELVRSGSVGVAVSVLAHAEFATKVIDRAASGELKGRVLPGAVSGEMVGALAVTEPGAGSDVAAIRTRAKREGGNYVIDGSKTFITNGTIADFITTAVRTGGPGTGGISLIVVPSGSEGLKRGRRLKKIGGHSSDTAELFFDACRVPVENLIGEEGTGFKLIMEGFEGERLVLALICCAQMRLLWQEARRYGLERQAFGRPLLGFQSWRHRLADAIATIEAAESLTYRAIDLYVGGERCNAEISMAKLFAAEAVPKVAHDLTQIFGGMGYMEETLAARLRRDSLAFSVGAGTSEIMREIIAQQVGLVPSAGEKA